MSDPFATALDTFFASVQACDVGYTPAGGAKVRVSAGLRNPDVELTIGGQARVIDTKRILEIRKSELPTAATDDTVEIPYGSGQNFRVLLARTLDNNRLVWTIEAAP